MILWALVLLCRLRLRSSLLRLRMLLVGLLHVGAVRIALVPFAAVTAIAAVAGAVGSVLAIPLGILAVRPRIGAVIDNAEIVFGMLEVSLGRDSVTGRSGVSCERQIPLVDLMSVSSNTPFRPTAVEVMPALPTTAAMVMLLAIGPPARPPSAITWSHDSLCFVFTECLEPSQARQNSGL